MCNRQTNCSALLMAVSKILFLQFTSKTLLDKICNKSERETFHCIINVSVHDIKRNFAIRYSFQSKHNLVSAGNVNVIKGISGFSLLRDYKC